MNTYIQKKINYSVFFIDMRLLFYPRNGGCYMTIPDTHGFILYKQRIKLFLSLSNLNFKSRINLMLELNLYSLIIVVSPCPLWLFFSNLACFIAFLALTTQLRIGELRGSTCTLLNLGWPCWLMLPYQ
jgi:hypothetical protein